MVHDVVVDVQLNPPGEDSARYESGAPPENDGALHVTSALALPMVALTLVGAPGIAAGITLADADDAGLSPMAFVATTVNL